MIKLSAKIEYACKALLELAIHWPNKEPLSLNIISRNQKIPLQFLNHILIHLKQLGYVESLRGKSGGYLLAVAPKEINLKEVLEDLGESLTLNKNNQKNHVFNEVWDTIDRIVTESLEKTTFENIVNKHQQQKSVLTYQI